jgi:AcrR family transcriptional regulator
MTERTYHHGNLRRALLDAALELFAERGNFDFTLRELARAADVTHGAPYRHFTGKAELLEALRDEGAALLLERSTVALERAGDDPRKQVRRLGEAYVRFALEHPHHFRLMLHNPLADEEPDRVRGEPFLLLERAFEAGRARGLIRSDLSAHELAIAAWALVHGLASLIVDGHLPKSERALRGRIASIGTIFFDGVAARSARN